MLRAVVEMGATGSEGKRMTDVALYLERRFLHASRKDIARILAELWNSSDLHSSLPSQDIVWEVPARS